MKEDYKTFGASANHLIVHYRLKEEFPQAKTYGFEVENADYLAKHINVENGRFYFEVFFKGDSIGRFDSQLPGRHNVENALAAISVAHQLALDSVAIAKAISSFKGVQRRFERVLDSGGVRLVDDYAHHPIEIKAAISAARELYPDTKITVVFQPHLFSRTRDFLKMILLHSLNRARIRSSFAANLSLLAKSPSTGVSSANLLNKALVEN